MRATTTLSLRHADQDVLASAAPAWRTPACREFSPPNFVRRRVRLGKWAWRAMGRPAVLTSVVLLLTLVVYVVGAATRPW